MTTPTIPTQAAKPIGNSTTWRKGQRCARGNCHRVAYMFGYGYCQEHAVALGIAHKRVAEQPIRDHIKNLLDQGANCQAIADAADLPRSTVQRVMRVPSKTGTMRYGTAQKILAVTVEDATPGFVPTWPVQRRWRSWRAAGWTLEEIAEACDVAPGTVQEVINPRSRMLTCHRDLVKRVREAWDRDDGAIRRPPTARIKAHAWPLPADWDDIDNHRERRYRIDPERQKLKENVPGDHPTWKIITEMSVDRIMNATGDTRDSIWKLRSRGPKGEVSWKRFDKVCTLLGIDYIDLESAA